MDMSPRRFEGRVAVVTGAGRGIGRAYAGLLSFLGAAVVVNDLGGTKEGTGADPEPAQTVAAEIVAAGGSAVADTNDVSSVTGSQAIIDAAVSQFGRIDIVVNNAGIVRWGGLPDLGADSIDHHHAVHVRGSFNTVRAAWPYMVEQDYGRIVLTTSTGMFGKEDNLAYAIAKAGTIGMAKALTVNAGDRNIKVNCIAPAAWTRMGVHPSQDPSQPTAPPPHMEPELVAPMVAFLAHEDCPVSGEVYGAGAGRCSRIFIAETPGYVHPGLDGLTIDDVGRHWAEINDEAGYYAPTSAADWSAHFMAHR
jgi:NAD(P)-dependent dehydrogenase (short-subunit alcohol dehydrogenase family)